jgi:predicted nuclease of predicted toxin-antitoxin system
VTIWLDNQLPPALAAWMRATLGVECLPIRDLHLQRASDPEIFTAARATKAVIMTKDDDFVRLVEQHGPPHASRAGHLRQHVKREPATARSVCVAINSQDA